MSKNKKNGISKGDTGRQLRTTNDVLKATTQIPSPVDLTSASPEKIVVQTDDALKIREAEEAVLRAKLQLSDLEVSISDLAFRKQELLNQIRQSNSQMMSVVRTIAEAYGIDPDGTRDDTKWNLNTNDMIFYRVQ